MTYVLSKKRSKTQHDKKDSNGTAAATWHLQELLQAAGISTKVRPDLVAMRSRARQIRRVERRKNPAQQRKPLPDGPEVLTWLRNRLVHPKDAGEPYRIDDLVSDAWRLATEYGELLLLHRIGYGGKYLPRTDKVGEWVNSVPVPWAP